MYQAVPTTSFPVAAFPSLKGREYPPPGHQARLPSASCRMGRTAATKKTSSVKLVQQCRKRLCWFFHSPGQ